LIEYDKDVMPARDAVMILNAAGDCSSGMTPMRRSFETD